VFQPAEDEFIAAVPLEPPVAMPVRNPVARRPREAESPRLVRPASGGNGGMLLTLGLVGGGFLVLLLACGGLGAGIVYLGYRSGSDVHVADAKAGAEVPGPVQNLAGAPKGGAPAPAGQQAQAAPEAPPGPPVPPLEVGPPPAPGATAFPVELLPGLKSATVFIKVENAVAQASGSGFLIRAEGDSGYVVTNHHVITPPDADLGPGPFGRPRFGIRGGGAPTITLVFWSGTPQEQSVRGDLVADDNPDDLAVLRFRGLRNPPRPIDLRQQPRLVETMPVFLFGFPFGQQLALNKGNPAITVGKGSVSSIRMNDRGEVARVQIDGDLNPGNSGGPVLDIQGRLVGVAVAKVRNTNIGMAIPAQRLTQLLAGHVPDFKVSTLKMENGTASVQVEAQVLDPMRQLRGVSVYYVRGNQAAQEGGLPGAQKADLLINGEKAVANLSLPAENQADTSFSFQVAYVAADGKTVFTPAKVIRLVVQVAVQQPAVPQAPAQPPVPKPLTDAALTRALQDLTAPESFKKHAALMRLAGAEPTKERRAEVVKAVEPLLQDAEWGTRNAAVKAYAHWAGKDGLPKVLPLVKDDNGLVRWAAFDSLKEWKDERCVDVVAECLVPFDRRGKASEVLRAVGQPAEKATLKYLTHQDWGVRLEVCRVLQEIGTKESVPALEKTVPEGGLVGPAAQGALDAIKQRR
jgi:S1-C subfamily serine protease